MKKDIATAIIAGGLLFGGFALIKRFVGFNKQALSLGETQNIAHEIKYQMLHRCFHFVQDKRENLNLLKEQNDGKADKLIQYFKDKVDKIYEDIQEYILCLYSVDKKTYRIFLKKYGNEPTLKSTQNELEQMMGRAINGIFPDLTVDKRVAISQIQAQDTIIKEKLLKIYEQQIQFLIKLRLDKIKQAKQTNPSFDCSAESSDLQKIIASTYHHQNVELLKSKGFKQQWGCPCQIFIRMRFKFQLEDPKFDGIITTLLQKYKESLQQINKHYSEIQKELQRKKKEEQEANKGDIFYYPPETIQERLKHCQVAD